MAKMNLGAVTAYADAVKAGFTGTREEFAEWLANAGKNAQAVADDLAESKRVLADVSIAGEAQVKAVQDEGAAQIRAVGDAAEEKKAEIAGLDAVQFDVAQNKSDAQKVQARANMGAAAQEDVDSLSEAIDDVVSVDFTWTDGKLIAYKTGAISADETYTVTQPIYIKGCKSITVTTRTAVDATGFVLYDKDMNYISGVNMGSAGSASPKTLTVEVGAAYYARFTCLIDYKAEASCVLNGTQNNIQELWKYAGIVEENEKEIGTCDIEWADSTCVVFKNGNINTTLDYYSASGVMYVGGFKTIKVTSRTNNDSVGYALYDKDMVYISGGGFYARDAAKTLDIDVGAAVYFQFSCLTAYKNEAEMKAYGMFGAINTINHLRRYPLLGKRIVFIGDSIFGMERGSTGVVNVFSALTMADCHNFAFGGTGSKNSGSNNGWKYFDGENIAQAIASGDFTAQESALAGMTDAPTYFAPTLAEMKSFDFSTADYIICNYATNDWTRGVTADEYKNAMSNIISTICAAYPNVQFIKATPTQRWVLENGNYISGNEYTNGTSGMTLKEFCEADNEIKVEQNIRVIDLFNIGINNANKSNFFSESDYTHQNANGRKRIAVTLIENI